MSRKMLIVLLVLFCGSLPVFIYWVVLGQIPTVNAQEALQMLNQTDNAALIDVRGREEFSSVHVVGAINWPLDEVSKVSSPAQVPQDLQNKTLLLVCASGFMSTKGVGKLQSVGLINVYNVRGGLQEWAKAGSQFLWMKFSRFTGCKSDYFAMKQTSRFEQVVAVLAGFFIKPTYMILSLILAWILRHAKSHDLVALRWSLLIFFIGEAFCAINYLFFGEDSYLAEYLHSYGMVAAFGFAAYAFIEGTDTRVIKFGAQDKRCAALEVCGSCFKYEDAKCKARRIAQFLIPSFIMISSIPFLAEPSHASYATSIFGTLYHYANPVIYQMFEIRYCPILAMLFFILAFLRLHMSPNQPIPVLSRVFFSGGLGTLGFAMFRLVFRTVYENNLIWAVFWEEATELIFIFGVSLFLWLFRRKLLRETLNGKESFTLRDMAGL